MSNLAFSQVQIETEAPFEAAFSDIIAHIKTVKDDNDQAIIQDIDWGLKTFEQAPHADRGVVARMFITRDTYDNRGVDLQYGWQNCDLAIFFGAYVSDPTVNIELQWRKIVHRVLFYLQAQREDHPLGLAVNANKYLFRAAPTESSVEETWKGTRGQFQKLNPGWLVRRINLPMKAWFNDFPVSNG
jgi:hypothetical protein